MDGMIEGGWNYVWAAYGISWCAILTYVAILIVRLKQGERDDN